MNIGRRIGLAVLGCCVIGAAGSARGEALPVLRVGGFVVAPMIMGEPDAVFFQNPYSAKWLAQKDGLSIRLIPLPLPPQRFEFGYARHANPEVIQRFDRIAERAFAEGAFKRRLEGATVVK